jgi:penicillin-binding protein 2
MAIRKSRKAKSFTRRAVALGGLKIIMLSTLSIRMYNLQVRYGEKYRVDAEENRIEQYPIMPPRGVIKDRFGKVLADGKLKYEAYVEFDKETDREAIFRKLSGLLSLEDKEAESLHKRLVEAKVASPTLVSDKLDWHKLSTLEENSYFLPKLHIESAISRDYMEPENMGHIIGYVAAPSKAQIEKASEDDLLIRQPQYKVGKSGIEATQEQILRGESGVQEVEVDARRTRIRNLDRHEPKAGQELTLTIDYDLQAFTMERLHGKGGLSKERAAAVCIDVETGDVLAMGSVPTYNPNLMINGVSTEYWKELTTNPDAPLTNNAVGIAISPGSTYKIMTSIAGLKSEKIKPSTTFHCPGYYELGNRVFHCWNRDGHGNVNLMTGTAGSCNVYFFNVALACGVNAISKVAHEFGLGEPTGIELPRELIGTIPDTAWKKKTFKEGWYDGETLNTAIGQGYVQTTPLQLAVQAARIASGKKVSPRLVLDPNNPYPQFPDVDVDPETMQLIRKTMTAVVNAPYGTGFSHRIPMDAYAYAGKTGTTQVVDKTFKYTPEMKKERYHALFLGFAPVDKPKYACAVVVIHGGYGGAVAAPIARDIFLKVQEMADRRSGRTPPMTYDSFKYQEQAIENSTPTAPTNDEVLDDNNLPKSMQHNLPEQNGSEYVPPPVRKQPQREQEEPSEGVIDDIINSIF